MMLQTIFLGFVGPWQWIIIGLAILLLFGGKKLPELMKGLGTGIKEFKNATNEEEEDLTNFNLEISVLSPLRKVESIEEIEVGTHGIYIEKSFYRGVLLPQVATEHNWDRHTFLKQTCIKAGLPTDAWEAEDAEIYVFSAQVFGEDTSE